MYKLLLKLSSAPDKDFGTYETKELARVRIREYLEEIKFKSYYWRIAPKEGDGEWIDFGSHVAFFEISKKTVDI